eukprot:13357765-Alexandrium_andersonii.AAC.1
MRLGRGFGRGPRRARTSPPSSGGCQGHVSAAHHGPGPSQGSEGGQGRVGWQDRAGRREGGREVGSARA